jgi:hypothetical protein
MPAATPGTAGGHARIEDPSTEILRLEKLASRVLSGDIQLPRFQRGFVWDREQILTLWDSLSKGYPIGSLLLWQTEAELQSERRIADLEIDLPRPGYPINYLLDGQQRLSTICGAMYWKPTNPDSRWNIVYDLREQKFLHRTEISDPPLHQFPLSKLSDASGYAQHLLALRTLASADRDELDRRLREFFQRFLDYKLATITVKELSVESVAPIFERVNSLGTALTIVDLMRAATWSPEFDLLDAIDGILAGLADKDFQDLDRKVVLRNISAAAGRGFSIESIDTLRGLTPTALKDACKKTESSTWPSHLTTDVISSSGLFSAA